MCGGRELLSYMCSQEPGSWGTAWALRGAIGPKPVLAHIGKRSGLSLGAWAGDRSQIGLKTEADLPPLLSLAVTSCTPRTLPVLTVVCPPRCSAGAETLL